jgi:hypothetical protein
MFVPAGNRRVAGITGNGNIVFMQQCRVDSHNNEVDAKLPGVQMIMNDLL